VYVVGGATGALYVIDAASNGVLATIPVGKRPWGVAVSADGRFVYTANGMSNDMAVVDVAANKVVGRVGVGQRPWGVAVTR
jgi:YVTN family beta-propeller protein